MVIEKKRSITYANAQKEYKTRHDWVDKVIHWELCKKLKFNHTKKWYMQTYNPSWKIRHAKTNHLISVRRPDMVIFINKKWNMLNYSLSCPGWTHGETERNLPYYQMVYAQPRISPGEWDARTSLGFSDAND